MLAQAGGVAIVPDVAQVRLERDGRTGRIWLQDLYDNPALDVALRPGDRIIVEEDRRSFTALGATTGQSRVPFNKRDMSALEAIATVGGLDGRSADPTGIFIFRDESAEVANRVLGAPRPRRAAADGLPARPHAAGGAVLGARLRDPRRGHDLHHRGAVLVLGAGPGVRDRGGGADADGRGHRGE